MFLELFFRRLIGTKYLGGFSNIKPNPDSKPRFFGCVSYDSKIFSKNPKHISAHKLLSSIINYSENELIFFISQSGETRDTLACLEEAKKSIAVDIIDLTDDGDGSGEKKARRDTPHPQPAV